MVHFRGKDYPDAKLPCNRERMLALAEALESGEYPQAAGALRGHSETGKTGNCCLGVACDLAAKAGVGHWGNPDTLLFYTPSQPHGEGALMPPEVMEFYGLGNNNDRQLRLSDSASTDGFDFITGTVLNDDGASFAAIAKIIREVYLTD